MQRIRDCARAHSTRTRMHDVCARASSGTLHVFRNKRAERFSASSRIFFLSFISLRLERAALMSIQDGGSVALRTDTVLAHHRNARLECGRRNSFQLSGEKRSATRCTIAD